MHAVHKRLALVALAATYVQFTVFAHLLGAGQRLQGSYHVATRVAAHHYIQRVHRFKTVALAKAVGAGCYHHLADGCGAFL